MENGMCYIFFGESFKDFNQGYGFHLFTFGGIFMKCLKKLITAFDNIKCWFRYHPKRLKVGL